MSDAVKIALIAALATIVPSYFAYMASRTAKATHDVVNSRMEKFLEMAKQSFRAEGKLEGAKEEKERTEVKVNQ